MKPLGEWLDSAIVAIPGFNTSAYLTLKKWKPNLMVQALPFDEILPAVAEGKFEAGLLIHESQLMYQDLGLHLLVDLGAWWKSVFDLPLPMGGNAIRKGLPQDVKTRFARLMRASVAMARSRHEESLDYAQSFGRGMDRDMVSRYVKGWVNEFTEDPGARGRRAVNVLLGMESEWIQG
jgi:1,4-dihydroxy-6-naphthoate synthase